MEYVSGTEILMTDDTVSFWSGLVWSVWLWGCCINTGIGGEGGTGRLSQLASIFTHTRKLKQ
jgi:hypothetical protein